MVIVPSPYREDSEFTYFTERGWSKLVEAVEQRNSTEDMTQLELVGRPTMESDDESGDDSEQNKTTVC